MKYYNNVIYLYISEVFLHIRSPRWAPLWLRLPRGPAGRRHRTRPRRPPGPGRPGRKNRNSRGVSPQPVSDLHLPRPPTPIQASALGVTVHAAEWRHVGLMMSAWHTRLTPSSIHGSIHVVNSWSPVHDVVTIINKNI